MHQQHANPRFYVGPNTNEIIIPIRRSYGVGVGSGVTESVIPVTITFTKRSSNSAVESLWSTYAISAGVARFEIPEEFRTNIVDFPKGFYDGEVKLDECVIGNVELVKAPGHYLSVGESIEDKCHGEDTWVEPECLVELTPSTMCGCSCNGDTSVQCTCTYQNQSGCYACYNQVTVAKIGLLAAYAGLDEIDVENCPLPDGGEPEEGVDTCIQTTSTSKPMISEIQTSNIPEGYIEDDSNC